MSSIKLIRLSALILIAIFGLFISCKTDITEPQVESQPNEIAGRVISHFGQALAGIKIVLNESDTTFSNQNGQWQFPLLAGTIKLKAISAEYEFSPDSIVLSKPSAQIIFTGKRQADSTEIKIQNWFSAQQLNNGLLESAENSNVVSLYDNALAAMVFMLQDQFDKAEDIFNFFTARINSELKASPGGYAQLRDANGVPNYHRWMGDNAWLLIAINHYRERTGSTTYDYLASEISIWLKSLQDTDGGLFAGYQSNDSLLNYKVTEGNLDAFAAVDGYNSFHQNILAFLEADRWDYNESTILAWPGNPNYLHALDVYSWSYALFKNYPASSLDRAQRFLTTIQASNGNTVTGYCFDEDKDAVWPEGTGQMALAFGLAGRYDEKKSLLVEMEKLLILSNTHNQSAGFPYASNPATGYGSDLLWPTAHSEIALSGGAWYLFAQYNFNPFALARNKIIPGSDQFWIE